MKYRLATAAPQVMAQRLIDAAALKPQQNIFLWVCVTLLNVICISNQKMIRHYLENNDIISKPVNSKVTKLITNFKVYCT